MAGAKIFLDYDQEALDAQLNLRARWPEHPEYFQRWAEESAAARARLPARLDLAYGPTPGQTLDLFGAETEPPAPLLAFIHGGYWQALDKGDFSYLAAPYMDAGVAYASLNYDLAPAVGIGEMVRQIRAALAWLYREAAALGIDRDRIYVAGHSAGGHLAAMTLATDWAGLDTDLPARLVKGGCSVSGIYDLAPVRLSYHQAVLGIDAPTAAEMSPVAALPAPGTPLILAVGSEETAEFHRQQAVFSGCCRDAGRAAPTIDLPGRNHFTAVDAMAEADHPLFRALRALILAEAAP